MTRIDDYRPTSDRLLRVFEAAGRLGSLSAAGRELGIGQPAVSHALARLEAAVGGPLMWRSSAGVELTPAGRELYDKIRSPYEEIDRAISSVRDRIADRGVTISVSTSLATYWLMPRLGDFKKAHPAVEVRVITTDSDRAVGVDDADLWIPLGRVDDSGLDSVDLCPEQVVPVVAGALDIPAAVELAELLHSVPLLHLEERYRPRFDWDRWFLHHGVEASKDISGYRSNDYSLILHAALEGQGVALGWLHIVSDLIRQGRLVPLGEPIDTGEPFQILSRPQLRESVAAMRNWLQAESAPSGGTSTGVPSVP